MANVGHGTRHGNNRYGMQSTNQFQLDTELAIQLSLQGRNIVRGPSTRAPPGVGAALRPQQRDPSTLQAPGHTTTVATSSSTRGGNATTATATCAVCADDTKANNSIAAGCGHRICRTCIAEIFRTSMTDRSRFPPRCCAVDKGGQIKLATAKHLLPKDLAREFEKKATEFTTANGLYCHQPRCSTFIPAANIKAKNKTGLCPQCGAKTCTLCKQAAHSGQNCPNDKAQKKLEKLADRKGWKPCPKCGVMVEKVLGCEHVKCLMCRYEFCFKCDRVYKTCHCDDYLFDEMFPAGHEVWVLPHHLREDFFRDVYGHGDEGPRRPSRPPRRPNLDDFGLPLQQHIPRAVNHHNINIFGQAGHPIPFGGHHNVNIPLAAFDHDFAGGWGGGRWDVPQRPPRRQPRDTRQIHDADMEAFANVFRGNVFNIMQAGGYPGRRRGRGGYLLPGGQF